MTHDVDSYKWDRFKLEIKKLDEPLLSSILQQVQFVEFKPDLNQVLIDLDQNLSFFQDILQDQRLIWLPKLQAVFGEHMSLEINLVSHDQVALPEIKIPASSPDIINAEAIDFGTIENLNSNIKYNNKALDFADQVRWPKVKLVLDFFPGTLSEISE